MRACVPLGISRWLREIVNAHVCNQPAIRDLNEVVTLTLA